MDLDAILDAGKHIGIILAELVIGIYFCKQYIEKLNKKLPIGKAVVEQNGINLDLSCTTANTILIIAVL